MSSPTKKEKKQGKRHNDFFFLLRHVRFSWLYIILAVAGTIIASVISGKIPDATAQLFDGNFEMSRLWYVVEMGILTALITLVTTLFTVIAQSKSTLAARDSIWKYMLNTRSEYYDEHDPSSLLSMVTVDAEQLATGLVTLFTSIPKLFTIVLMAAVMMLMYNKKLLWVLAIIIPMHIIYMFVVGRWQQRIGKDFSIEVGNLTGYLTERIRNLMMVKSFVAEEKEDANGMEASGRLYKVNKRYAWLAVVLGSYNVFSTAASTVVTVLWGCHLLKNGEIDLPAFLGFQMYVPIINLALVFVSIVWTYVKDFQGRAFRISRLIESPREEDDKGSSTEIPDGDLEVRNLDFAYGEGKHNVLSDINFTIPKGSVTAIVGSSGSGKTTMIKLLERLYTPTGGEITVGGADISGFSLSAWRRKLAYVVQDAGVFGGTLREAFCYGSREIPSDERLMEVAEQVGLKEFVESLPERLDTMLGTWGGSVSGGQRQRIVIARALLQDADILVFDEPTSALDPESANAISKMILEKFKGKTVIIISHELNYIAAADHIVVIDQGKLEASGKHQEIMETCPVYRELVEEQSYQEVFGV